jgi:hypothetical protein
LEELQMQPAAESYDIHTILGRFSRWTGKEGGNGKAGSLENLDEGVRELSYEEAMQKFRNRQAGPATRATPRVEVSQAPADPELAMPRVAQAAREPAKAVASPKQHQLRKVGANAAQPRKTQPTESAARKAETVTVSTQKQRKKSADRSLRIATPNARDARALKTQKPEMAAFRNVLAESLRSEKPAAIPGRARRSERSRRVSVRLSSDEESLLQQCAARAGVTVSEYLRMRALDGQRVAAPEQKPSILAPAEIPVARNAAAVAPAPTAKSGFGEWISLLRNRFLASPVRFAERA